MIRALSCFLVACVHLTVPTWTDPLIKDANFFENIILAIIDTGWIGVSIFLFISGYSLSLNKIKKNAKLNVTQFFSNRLLRIMPLWIICISILISTHSLDSIQVISLLFLQMSSLPSSTFSLAWSLQWEFACYLLFPIFFYTLCNNKKHIIVYFLFFFSS